MEEKKEIRQAELEVSTSIYEVSGNFVIAGWSLLVSTLN